MSGLRIVFEESDTASMLRSEEAIVLRPPEFTDEYVNSETLLPPLPESDEEISRTVASLVPTTSGVSFSGLSSAFQARPATSPRVVSSPSTLKEFQQHQETSAAIQGMDLSSLTMDSSPFSFPSIDPPSPGQSSFPPGLSKSSSSTSINTSPLKRLKSLKNGLRRLSLSRKGSSSLQTIPIGDLASCTSSSALGQPSQSKPSIYPIQTDTCLHDASSSSSTGESLRSSTFSSGANNMGQNTHTAVSTPVGPSHISSSSQGSSIMAKSRRRTISQSNSAISTTPPFPSPIITLSENLSSSQKNLVSIEQSFFDNMQSSTDSYQQVLGDDSADTISRLNTSNDLIDYSIYLSQHKKSVETAYEVSKAKLVSSGWCSEHDIENLVLHRDSVLSQIDSKLLKIEEKLNSDFNISILNNPQVDLKSPPHGNPAIKTSLSPSLKDLESRCLFSTSSSLLQH